MLTRAILIANLLAPAGLAFAGDQPITNGQVDFVDKNHDGKLSKQEYLDYMQNAFKYLDANGNGSLDMTEAGTVLTEQQFQLADGNHNGTISQAELLDRAALDYAGADKDNSGNLN